MADRSLSGQGLPFIGATAGGTALFAAGLAFVGQSLALGLTLVCAGVGLIVFGLVRFFLSLDAHLPDRAGGSQDRSGRVVDGSGGVVDGSGGVVDGSGRVVDRSGGVVDGSGGVVDGSGGVVDGSGSRPDDAELVARGKDA